MRDVYFSHDDANLQVLIAACDEALTWADANMRWFDISTAPTDRDVLFWDGFNKEWQEFRMLDLSLLPPSYTHWREPLPPPSNPPLPEPLERLGEVLRRVKGVS